MSRISLTWTVIRSLGVITPFKGTAAMSSCSTLVDILKENKEREAINERVKCLVTKTRNALTPART